MTSIYYKFFNFLDSSKPTHFGIYFSLLFHLSILLFTIGLPDFFKSKQIPIPKIIPIEILNVSDTTSLISRSQKIDIENKQKNKIKEKKFNSSENKEIQKIDLQEKPKKKIIKNESVIDNNKSESLNIPLKEKQINKLKSKEKIKLNNIETLKKNIIKPKLKPQSVKIKQTKSDLYVESKTKPIIKKNDEKNILDKPQPIQKPEKDFNIASMLKDLRNEEILNVNKPDNEEKDKLEDNEQNNQIKPNLEVSISEMDLVIQQLRSCFNPRAGTQIVGSEMVKIRAQIDRNAYVKKDTVQIIDTNISKSHGRI